MPQGVLTFTNVAAGASALPAEGRVVVLSPWWTPPPGSSPHVVALRPLAARVLQAVDVPGTAVARLDEWAVSQGVVDRFLLNGVSWWDRVRMAVRWDMYEIVLWHHVLDALDAQQFAVVRVPAGRRQLAAICRAWGLPVELVDDDAPAEAERTNEGHDDRSPLGARRDGEPTLGIAATPDATLRRSRVAGMTRTALVRLGLRRPPPPRLTRRQQLDRRFEDLAAQRPILALTWAGALQVLGDDPARRGDPFIDPAISRLIERGEPVAMVALGRDHRDLADWEIVKGDERVLPFSYVRARGRRDDDPDPTVDHIVLPPGAATGLRFGSHDLAPAVVELLESYTGRWLATRRLWGTWAGRFLDELQPRALLIDREGTRVDWMSAARRRGIPVVAVQHGMIYRGNPEYFRAHVPGSLVPDRTCVFGPWERDLLVREAGFPSEAVTVTGSPRAPSLERVTLAPEARTAVRESLGVARGDAVLTVSAAHNPIGELMTACMLGTLLDGPLPDTHIVVKAHPQDREPGDYPGLFAGLAAAGGYEPPPVTVIRDVNLTRLLAASDAHLGHTSTVLTDAVAVGTPNMIAGGQAQADPIGYVQAGVGHPVRGPADVRAFLAAPPAQDPAARAAFLAAHFLPGDATGRLVDVAIEAAARA